MINLIGGVTDCGEDVITLKESVIVKDFFVRGAVGEEFKYIGDADAFAADAGLAATFSGFESNSGKQIGFHMLDYIMRIGGRGAELSKSEGELLMGQRRAGLRKEPCRAFGLVGEGQPRGDARVLAE